jgi:hypothetical protein
MNKNTPPDPDAIEETEPEAAVEAHPLRSVEEILEESLDARNDSPDDEDTASGSPAEEPGQKKSLWRKPAIPVPAPRIQRSSRPARTGVPRPFAT